jgi:hypothetical protein
VPPAGAGTWGSGGVAGIAVWIGLFSGGCDGAPQQAAVLAGFGKKRDFA